MNSENKPKISFIVPIYNVDTYLRDCLDSILMQTMGDFEAILVDDGSPDSSGIIADEYAARDERFKVIHKKNEGVSAARNDGVDAANGEWAYFVDSDDWLEPDAAECLVKAAEENGVDCVMSYAVIHSVRGEVASPLFSKQFIAREKKDISDIQKYVLYQAYSPYYTRKTIVGYAAPWAKFVKMSIIKKNQVKFDPYLKGVFDDGLYSLNLLEHVNSLMYLDRQTYNYRVVESSLTHAFKLDAMEIQKRGYDKIEELLRSRCKDDSFWEAYYAHVVRFFGGYLTRYFYNPNNPKSNKEINEEVKRYLELSPWKEAAAAVDYSRLRPKDKLLAISEKTKCILGLKLYCILKYWLGK